jgi:hypothetical protein
MEEVVLCSVKDKKGDISGDILKEVRNSANIILNIITGWMHASTYFKVITRLLEHPKSLVKRKVIFFWFRYLCSLCGACDISLIVFHKAHFAPFDCNLYFVKRHLEYCAKLQGQIAWSRTSKEKQEN